MKQIHGFTTLDEAALPEYRARGIRARHIATGCEVYHVHNDDPENLFSFVFTTLPIDSTGVAHILEHTVLCGSRRFPVKDPFVMLMRGSLNTFVNAMTYPDKTVYPASSTIARDLFNIMEVYGDAVFSPLLRKEFFLQEGCRLEFTEGGSLRLTGIVYNEMKGNYANHDSLVAEWSYRSLLPDTPYAHDAGGDPAEIPDLDYDRFVAFHRRWYHPSNARIFLYGNIPTERYLEFLDARFLSRFGSSPNAVHIPTQPRWNEPRGMTVTCPADEKGEGPTSVTVNWLLDSVTDPYRVLSLELLSEILLGTSAAPLRRRLIESGLGEDLSAATGLESELRELVFSAGLRGTEAGRREEIEQIIFAELQRLADEGIDPDIVEGSLRKVEFRNREIRGGPNGLRLMGKSLRGWLHGESPDATLRFADPFRRLRGECTPGSGFFERLIRHSLLENPHRSTVLVIPDPDQRERERQALEHRLSDVAARLTADDRERIRWEQTALAELQQAPDPPEAVASIPFLHSADLPRNVETLPVAMERIAGDIPVHTHELFTNGVVYLDVAFDLSGVGEDALAYLPFYAGALAEVGLPERNYDEVATEVALKTGGLGAFVDASGVVDRPEAVERRLFFRVKALESLLPEAVDLMQDILSAATLDNAPRLAELWRERRSEISGAILPAGSGFALLRAARGLARADRYEEVWQGITQLVLLARDTGAPARVLSRINDMVVRRDAMIVNVTGEEAGIRRALGLLEPFADAMPVGVSPASAGEPLSGPFPSAEALVVPSEVAYVAEALPGARLGSAEHAHELLLAHLLRTGYLWETIRMRGGAYGANASARGMDGVFSFTSYRDPRIAETLAAFADGLRAFAEEPVGDRELELAQIGVTGHDIRPLSPGQKGLVALRRSLYGVTDEMRQQRRNDVLSATADDIRRAAGRLRDTMGHASIAVMASSEAVDAAAAHYPGLAANKLTVPV